ncbi:MAG: histidine kinase, dimerization and phosphoacceptor region [Frankiales bacterium]|nr:histidine kinase, dimerization and phosphoacceptor region [Frankiales bacterium]
MLWYVGPRWGLRSFGVHPGSDPHVRPQVDATTDFTPYRGAVLDRLTTLASRVDLRVLDALVALAVTVLCQVQLAGTGPVSHLALLVTLVVAFRRRAPLLVACVLSVGLAMQGLSDQPPSVLGEYLTVLLICFTTAQLLPLRKALLALLIIVVAIVLHDINSPEYGSLSGMVSDIATPLMLWGVGRAVRSFQSDTRKAVARAAELQQAQDEVARRAVEAERAHLARELHDVVTHSLSVVVVQAQGASRVLASQPALAAEALTAIEEAGRTAMTEMRRLLGLLREHEEASPTASLPGTAQLPELVAQVRGAGLDLSLSVQGEPVPVSPGLDLSLYRIAQEALTNALKHAGPSTPVSLELEWGREQVRLRVADSGPGPTSDAQDGRGLLGMRERVAFYGGTLCAQSLNGSGFVVEAVLPTAAP